MISDMSSMINIEEKAEETRGSSPKGLTRPRLTSYQSNSVPATPRQHAREFTNNDRSPSPTTTVGQHSPRSVSSEANRNVASLRPTNPACKFQSTQTSRRRIPYNIGTDMLEPEVDTPRASLSVEEKNALSRDLKRLYNELLPSAASEDNRRRVVQKLKHILQEEWPDRKLEVSMFGSSGNLLYTNKSDGARILFSHIFCGKLTWYSGYLYYDERYRHGVQSCRGSFKEFVIVEDWTLTTIANTLSRGHEECHLCTC